MATTAEAGMSAGSNIVTGAGTASRSFTLPGAPLYVVQSVVATVDNTAGGATTATLTFADTNGEVIAKRAQGDAIPAGDTGTATFALRLAGNSGGVIRFNRTNIGGYLTIQLGAGQAYRLLDSTGADLINYDESGSMSVQVPAGGNWGVFRGGGSAVVEVWPDRSFQISCHDFDISASGDTAIFLRDTTVSARALAISSDSATWEIDQVGGSLTIRNSAGNPIFRVDEDGDLHGLTGKALTFDL